MLATGIATLALSCAPDPQQAQVTSSAPEATPRTAVTDEVRGLAERYFELYAQRSDWTAFLALYADDVRFFDDRLGLRLEGKAAFADFYDWPDARFALVDPQGPALVLHDLVVEDRRAVARGRFTPFHWGDAVNDWPGEFTIWLSFNTEGRIEEQRDLIPYPKSLLPEAAPAPD